MRIKQVFLALALASLICPYQSTGQQSELERLRYAKARVHIVLTDGAGRNIGAGVVASFENPEGVDFAKTFHENNAAAIPYDVYNLEVYQTGSSTVRRTVDVFAPEVWVVVGLKLGEEKPQFPVARMTVIGKIKHLANPEWPVYVRLVGVYSNYLADDRVSVSGNPRTFQIAGIIPDGKFVLLFHSDKGLLCTMPIELPKDKNLEIDDLEGCHR